jgi:hypothetical protein
MQAQFFTRKRIHIETSCSPADTGSPLRSDKLAGSVLALHFQLSAPVKWFAILLGMFSAKLNIWTGLKRSTRFT